MRHLGILGGTFNPPHIGHLTLARHARSQLSLEQVLLMPAYRAPNKPPGGEDPGSEHRLQMCRLAVAHEPGLQASALEIEREGTSYTVDTVQGIHDTDPDVELTLIVGADTAHTLPGWREPAKLLGMVRLAIAQRDELDLRDVSSELASLTAAPGSLPRITLLQMTPLDVSSSKVRSMLAAGESVTELVGAPVAEYIAMHGLYRPGAPVAANGAAA